MDGFLSFKDAMNCGYLILILIILWDGINVSAVSWAERDTLPLKMLVAVSIYPTKEKKSVVTKKRWQIKTPLKVS